MNIYQKASLTLILMSQLQAAPPQDCLCSNTPINPLQEIAALEDMPPEQALVLSPETAASLAAMLSQLTALLEQQPITQPALNDQAVVIMAHMVSTVIAAQTPSETQETKQCTPPANNNARDNDKTTRLVTATFASIASHFATIIAQPHNKQVVAHTIAQMFANIIAIIRDVTQTKSIGACSEQDVMLYFAKHHNALQIVDAAITTAVSRLNR